MIEDFDGPDPAPNRRVHMRVVSVALALAAVVGYAAASSTAFQRPFAEAKATPRPSPTIVVAPPQIQFIDLASVPTAPDGRVICWAPAAYGEQLVFVGGRITVTTTGTAPLSSASPTCVPRPTPDTSRPSSVDRVSR